MKHTASSQCDSLSLGMTFCVQGGSLHRGDRLQLELENGSVEAHIERFDITGLYLTIDGARADCRPWQNGDKPLARCRGTSSSWTIESVEADEMSHA